MSQTSITSFFNSRKRPASDDIITSKNKVPHVDRSHEAKILVSGKGLVARKFEISKKELKLPNKSTEVKKDESKQLNNQHGTSKEAKPIPPKVPAAFSKKVNASNTPKSAEPARLEAINSSRKELSLGDIRKKLAGSSRLAELRATADRLSKGIQELKEASDKRNLKQFKSIDVEVPSRYVLIIIN